MRTRIALLVLLIELTLLGCQGFVHEEQLIGRYKLIAVDTDADMSVCYLYDDGALIAVVGPTVVAVGFDQRFIIAKQHPYEMPYRPDTTTTNYFIIPIKELSGYEAESNLIGPMNEEQFLIKRDELGVPKNLKFDKEL